VSIRRMSRRGVRRLRFTVLAAWILVIVIWIATSVGSHRSTPPPNPSPRPAAVEATVKAKPSHYRAALAKRHKRRRPHVTPAPTTQAPPVAATPSGCYPFSDEGTCYEPGEYCRDSDEGMTGVAGDGEQITCEYNDGLRWEPA
jgi:hypothetical protein